MTTPRSVRLSADLDEKVGLVMEVRGISFTSLVVEALAEKVERELVDPEFRARVEAAIERHRRLLDRLAGS